MSNQPPYGYPGGQQGYQGGPPPPSSPQGKTKTLNLEYNMAALLCYIPTCCCLVNVIPCIIWLATEPKENRLLRFHSLQGLFLAGVWIAVWILSTVVQAALGMSISFSPGASTGLAMTGAALMFLMVRVLVGVTLLVIHIVAMVKANQGQMWKIPVIGDLAEKNC